MPQLTIIDHLGTAAVLVPATWLESAGLRVGDAVDATHAGRELVIRPLGEAERRAKIQALTDEVLERRRDAYRRLA